MDIQTIPVHLTHYMLVITDALTFELWHGWLHSDSNLHYAKFSGLDADSLPIWVLSRSDEPQNAVGIAKHEVDMLLYEARKACHAAIQETHL